ncbi:MAG TPA: cation diffusion facilitator family transporter [Herpetosiphonaceae bacterium]
MGHAHSHAGHGHHHGPVAYGRAFAIGVTLNLSFVIVEFTFGYLSNSLALIADAGHNLSDVLGLLFAWGAAVLATRQPTARRTYGLRRSSILAAVANAVLLLVAVGGIAWEAIQRFGEPGSVAGTTVIWVAAIGCVINTATALMFMRGQHNDINIKGAFLHMAADAAVSLGVVIAGIGINMTGWQWLDPITSLIIAGVILVGTWGLLRDSVNLALDGVPAGIDVAAVTSYLQNLPGVTNIHDLHIWGMSTTESALTAHLVVTGQHKDPDALIVMTTQALHDQFGIEHATLQLETKPRSDCCSLGQPAVGQLHTY